MCYFDSSSSIKEQLKNIRFSIPKLIIFFATETVLVSISVFFGIIGAYIISSIILILTMILVIFFPVAKQKNKET